MTTVVKSEKEDQLIDQYNQKTSTMSLVGLISDQIDLIRLGLDLGKNKQVVLGGVDVLQLLVGDFWESANEDVEVMAQKLKDNGLGQYVGGEA